MSEIIPNVHVVRADFGRYAEAYLKGNFVGIGWIDDRDLSDMVDAGKDVLGDLYGKYYPEAAKMSQAQGVGQVWRFLTDIQVDDVVITPTMENSQLLVGVVTSDYYYDPDDYCPYPHRKQVKWFKETLRRSTLSIPLQNTLRSSLTVFQVRDPEEILQYYGFQLPEKSKKVALTDQSIIDLILDSILELSADEFEILVTELLSAIGFEANHVGKTGDEGIDVEGNLRVYQFASVDLKVQVKRYQKNRISHRTIIDFRGKVPERSHAAFVTTSDFTEKARDEAEREGFKQIGLINGNQLVEILIEHYDDLTQELKDQLQLRKTLIPTLK